jgi:GNAT superfamily N-acetyltransferase
MMPELRFSPLSAADDFEDFSCGEEALDRWIRERAWSYERGRYARTIVAWLNGSAVGFVTLAAGAVVRRDAPHRIGAGFSHEMVPVVVLARLAVDWGAQGRGVGRRLLASALRRVDVASRHVGVRAVIVHAKDATAAAFYEHHDFAPFPGRPSQLFVLMKDLHTRLHP